jgi:hypothetical protein
MGTDSGRPQVGIPPEVDALMMLLANLNAGAMLALCLWLASAAFDYNARQAGQIHTVALLQQCGCNGIAREGAAWTGGVR